MSFDPAWLDLRAAADRTARDPELLTAAAAFAGEQPDPLIVDLGAGTGANIGTLAGYVGQGRWRLVDADGDLLAIARKRFAAPGVEFVQHDLAAPALLPVAGARLVTASALLDLVSADWMERLAREVAAAGAGFYAALSFDGRMSWQPAHRDDGRVAAAFLRHQRGDKGFGPALGPDAHEHARRVFATAGYEVRVAASPWRLGPEDAALTRALVAGIAAAAAEIEPDDSGRIRLWEAFRLSQAAAGPCEIGHYDLLALPSAGLPPHPARSQSTTSSPPRS